MSDASSRLTLSQEDFRYDFSDKNLNFSLFIREVLQNFTGYSATECRIVTASIPMINKLNLVFFLANAKPWENVDSQLGSLKINTSYGDKGRNGGGAKLSALTLVNSNSEFQLHFLSIKKNELIHTFGTFDDNIMIPKIAKKEWTDEIKRVLGNLIDGMNVIYVAPFNPQYHKSGSNTFCNFSTMLLASDITGDLINKGLKVNFYPYLKLSSDKTYKEYFDLKDNSSKDYKNARCFSMNSSETFDELFMDSKFEFKKIISEIQIDGKIIKYEANMEFKLYSGIRLSDGDGDQRYSLIALRGESKGKSKSYAWTLNNSANTFIKSSYVLNDNKNNQLHRLAEQPHYFGRNLEDIGCILNIPISNTKFDFKVKEDSEWKDFVNDSKENRVSQIKRTPFCKVIIDITKIISISEGKIFVECSNSEIRSIFGGINEIFVTKKNTPMKEVIKSVCVGILQSDQTKILEKLQSRTRELFPIDMSQLVSLPTEIVKTYRTLHIKERNTQKPITKIKVRVGESIVTDCDIFREDGSIVKGDDVNFVIFDVERKVLGKSSLTYTEGQEGGWSIKSAPLMYKKDDVFVKAISEDDWLKNSNEQTSLPNKEIIVFDKISHITYRLSVTHELPTRNISKGRIKTGIGKRKVIHSMFFRCDPSDCILKFEQGMPIFNMLNSNIELWSDGFKSLDWHKEIYKEITNICLEFVNNTKCAKFEEWNCQKTKQIWNDDLFNYLLNLHVKNVFFDSPKIKKAIQEIIKEKEKLGINSVFLK